MEKTVATPYWTGMTLFTVSKTSNRPRHLLHDPMYQARSRVAFKGQVFSAPMDWANMVEQLDMKKNSKKKHALARGIVEKEEQRKDEQAENSSSVVV